MIETKTKVKIYPKNWIKKPPNNGSNTVNKFKVPLIPKYTIVCSGGAISSKYGSKPILLPLITNPIRIKQ